MPDTFAVRLARLRAAAGLSVAGLASAAGVSRQTVHALLRGDGEPSLATARRLAQALGVSLAAFDDCE